MNGPYENSDPDYRRMVDPFTVDKRNRVIPTYGIRKKKILLDVALVQQEFKLLGDFVYVDYNSTGVAECSLNSPSEDAFPLLSLAGVQNIPYEGLYITAAAQAGLFLNLWYGYASQFISPTSAIATIGSITNPVKIEATNGNDIFAVTPFQALLSSMNYQMTQDGGFSYGVSFKSTTVLAANVSEQVFAPGSNTLGAVIWTGQARGSNGVAAAVTLALQAHTAAPNGFALGDVLAMARDQAIFTGFGSQFMELNRSTRISSGKGVYHTAGTLEGTGNRFVNYTLF